MTAELIHGRLRALLATAASAWILGCGPSIPAARTSRDAPPSPREIASAERVQHRRCGPNWGFLYPGLSQFCLNKPADGAFLASLGTVEAGALIAGVAKRQASVAFVTGIGVEDLWVYGISDAALEQQRADQRLFVPQDTLGELLVAPFNVRILSLPTVWAGILGTSVMGSAVSILLLNRGATFHPGAEPRLFGQNVDPALGYPLAALSFSALFSQVTIAEEATFRGVVQSGLSRSCGQACGWALSSGIFGLFHATNAFFIKGATERERYLGIAVPLLTLTGQALGGSYWAEGYRLSAPVAMHFWYNFILSAVGFAADPRASPISARIGFGF